MKKIHQFLPNVGFFGALILVYFGYVAWAHILAMLSLFLYIFFTKIEESNALKYSFKTFGSYLLFSALGVFQWSIFSLGILSFLFGLMVVYLKQKQSKQLVLIALLSFLGFSAVGFILPSYLAQIQVHEEVVIESVSFELIDVATSKTITENDVKGKVVVINFWATWCSTCLKEMKVLNEIYAKHFTDRDEVVFLIANSSWSGDTFEKVRQFADKKDYTMPLHYDEYGLFAEKLDVESIPTLFIMDKKGTIRVKHQGYMAGEDFEGDLISEIEKLN